MFFSIKLLLCVVVAFVITAKYIKGKAFAVLLSFVGIVCVTWCVTSYIQKIFA
jgi:hypothetical protein